MAGHAHSANRPPFERAPPSAARNYDMQIKLMMIGDQAVGKTALLVRFADDDFNESVLPTIGIDFKIKTIELGGKRIKLQIWDTAGQERFRTITQAYYRGAMGILLLYDVTNAKSLQNVRNWVRNIEGNAPQTVNKVLVGNKSDMAAQRQVLAAEGQKLADEFGMRFFETSARNNQNVSETFLCLANDVVERLLASGGELSGGSSGTSLTATRPAEKNNPCC
mmetsp:Transcript_41501/g.133459  ORF Transcript_41501/g.133459 Transcript_41501/m.133459 type:complete len:222 (+) Transcript_41501:2-667(+)